MLKGKLYQSAEMSAKPHSDVAVMLTLSRAQNTPSMSGLAAE
jgi:hypothetical protein